MGMTDRFRGKAEEMKGKMTHNRTTEMKGKARQSAASAQDKLDHLTDKDHRAF